MRQIYPMQTKQDKDEGDWMYVVELSPHTYQALTRMIHLQLEEFGYNEDAKKLKKSWENQDKWEKKKEEIIPLLDKLIKMSDKFKNKYDTQWKEYRNIKNMPDDIHYMPRPEAEINFYRKEYLKWRQIYLTLEAIKKIF